MKKWIVSIIVLSTFQVASLAIHTSYWKNKIRNWWTPNKDKLLAVSYGDIDGQGNIIKVLKFQTRLGVRVEFLKEQPNGVQEHLRSYHIKHPYNGFFEYRGNSVQLAMGDVDGDGTMEVLAPTFDHKLMAHLNVYYYDSNSNNFYKRMR